LPQPSPQFALLAALPARGQPYPSKPIRVVVPLPRAALGYPRARDRTAYHHGLGPAGHRGKPHRRQRQRRADFVAKSAPDGYTMLLSDVGALSINPSVYADMPFDPAKDFSPIVMVSYSPHVLAVHPSVPVANVKELIAYAKANPGRLNFANSGTGGARTSRASNSRRGPACSGAYIPTRAARRRSRT